MFGNNFLGRHRLDDVQRILALNDFENNDPDLRSLSPDPIYDPKTGVRLNTRESRNKERYNKEKNTLIEDLLKMDPTFVPPADYRPSKKIRKIYVSEPDNPATNVFKLVIGQKGKKQKEYEQKTNCKISVRGRGAAQTTYNRMESNDHEPLHVLIQGDTEEDVQKAVDLIEPLINSYGDSRLRGTVMLREAVGAVLHDEFCENCFARDHKLWNCPHKIGEGRKKVKFSAKTAMRGVIRHMTVPLSDVSFLAHW
eukprot:TRINITY_DN3012_c0_g1_i28.p1 TRINITY_DN3012_c0_g1~~TRINITY_DN3012_c0_g1_i28.p1  ORF type:complete len:253 (+),score=56.92 TRINITY_DN3012_c0_g1_i28:139-897(+)